MKAAASWVAVKGIHVSDGSDMIGRTCSLSNVYLISGEVDFWTVSLQCAIGIGWKNPMLDPQPGGAAKQCPDQRHRVRCVRQSHAE